jgi:predicted Rossmann fold nucleotide-binding protein DprA/Smf involved in DNA uptake
LGFAVEQWNQSGLWVVSRSDAEYPRRYKDHLKEKAPPLLFGAGDPALLQGGGLAIVGSRDVDDAGQAFAGDVALWCARGGMPVISGGARGVDQIALPIRFCGGV